MTVNASEVTSRANVFSIAAELVERNMQEPVSCREGCCAAFNQIIVAVDRDYNTNYGVRQDRISMVRRAKSDFEAHFRPTRGPLVNEAYWMGTRENSGMKRRVDALLTASVALKR